MAIGCIQAQRCHTNHCFAGVATHHPWLVRGVDPTSKAARLGNYIITLRKDVLALSRACRVPHPALITADIGASRRPGSVQRPSPNSLDMAAALDYRPRPIARRCVAS